MAEQNKPWQFPAPKPGEDEATSRLKKKHSAFFAAVRARGILNHMLDGPAKAFDDSNPGFKARWEYCPASGDKTFIVAREGLGFHIVDASELGDKTTSEQKEGPVKVGDLILMAAPDYVVAAIEWRTPGPPLRTSSFRRNPIGSI